MLSGVGELITLPQGALRDEDSLAAALSGCSAVVTQHTDRIGDRLLATAGLRLVANVAVGHDNIDLEAAARRHVLVTNTPGIVDETTADLAFALLLAAARRLSEADREVRAGAWTGFTLTYMLGQEVHGSTLGVIGLGRVGRAVARRARSFNMPVVYHNRNRLPEAEERELGVEWVPLAELLRRSDFVSLHVPLNGATRHLIGPEELALMKPSAVLVNTARGPVIDEAALARALEQGGIFAAGLDVYEDEPRVSPELRRLPNVVLAPHVGSATVRTRTLMCTTAAANVEALLRGGRPPHILNPEVWDSSR
ncbi:MAG TPA: D-glycerate dehydrogenase [Candidatus Dormibacteraeota bacterium]|jgi:glyoxylate reductase|nr:D-glycerate dehydrogenase [Candidatus Dormibacteraeota bacterium]